MQACLIGIGSAAQGILAGQSAAGRAPHRSAGSRASLASANFDRRTDSQKPKWRLSGMHRSTGQQWLHVTA